jgi:predicted metalloprotease
VPGYAGGPSYGYRARRRRFGPLRVVGLAVAVVLALVIGLQLVGRFGLGPQPAGVLAGRAATSAAASAPAASATPTAYPPPTAGAPSATSRPKPEPDRPNRSLTRNTLYAVDLDGTRVTCGIKVRPAKPPLRNADLAPYLRSVVKCLMKVHRKPLADQGFKLTEPRIKVYRATVSSPCGRFDQKGAPAYYCSADQTIYWPASRDDGREAYTFARMGYVALLAHEFGHHLQAVTGIVHDHARHYAAAKSRSDRYLLSRRLELQAQCFEGVFLGTVARSLELSGADRDELRMWHGYTGDEDPPDGRKPDHGSSAAQIRWLIRGLDSQDFGRCNTWTARRSAVR